MTFVKHHWKKLLAAALLTAALAGFGLWYSLFRIDPEFRAADAANQQQLEALDQALGLGDDSDFPAIEREPPNAQTR